MNTRSILRTGVVCLGFMIAATAAEAMPASSSLVVTPAIQTGGAQVEQAALVVVRRPVRRVIVRHPFRRRVIVR